MTICYHYHRRDIPTGKEVAAQLGISRRTLYRWMAEGRLPAEAWGDVAKGRVFIAKRARGPRRNPLSKRYHEGRHRF